MVEWSTIKSYDDIYPEHSRDAAMEVIARATHKCEFLNKKGEHFRFCGIDDPDTTSPVGPDSPLVELMRVDNLLPLYCYNKGRCPRFSEKIGEIIVKDKNMLVEECRRIGIDHVPKEADPSRPQAFKTYCQILGKNYPVQEFPDRGEIRQFPYTIMYGHRIPIICAASVIATTKFSSRNMYMVTQEAKQGSGDFREDRYKFDIPGGGIDWKGPLDPTESFEDCARREFKEEIGKEVTLENLVGVVARISQNRKLIFKAVYTAKVADGNRQLPQDDSMGHAFFTAGALRMLSMNRLLKTSDIILLINRVEEDMLLGLGEIGRENAGIHMGWDRAWE